VIMSKTNDTAATRVLTDSELNTVAGGLAAHNMGPSNYQKKNVTTYGPQPGGGLN